MKKLIAIMLAFIMVAGMTACMNIVEKQTPDAGAQDAAQSDTQKEDTQKQDEQKQDIQKEDIQKQDERDVAQDDGEDSPEAHVITLTGDGALIDGAAVEEFDYVWKIDPGSEQEWYEGSEPQTDAAAYIAHDIWYYPQLDESGFSKEVYDGDTEWVYRYTAEGLTDYIFSTLPVLGSELPAEMMHTAGEAYENKVLHITKSGTYTLEGSWQGQIFVDLGDTDETFTDESAKVTIILNGVDVSCSCAPAIVFYSAYECDNTWEDRDSYTADVDTSDAGVTVVIADGTENNFTGANVYRLLKAKYKSDSSTVQKKAHKMDGAFYSFVSMNINSQENGTGILNIRSTTYEGLGSELHLTINGGYINIYSQDDGINVNEDDVSVFAMNGGVLHIFAGLGAEGDCVDSNGYIVVNGGIIAAGTPSGSDAVLDSDRGNIENGGEVIIVGSGQGAGGFGGFGGPGGFGGFGGEMPEPPEGFGNFGERPEPPEGIEGFGNFGERPEPPEGLEGFGVFGDFDGDDAE